LKSWRLTRKIVRWLLFVVILMYVFTGYGITEFRTVESITFGLLTKPLSFVIHHYLIYPMAGLLAVHVAVPIILRLVNRNRNRMEVPPGRVIKVVK